MKNLFILLLTGLIVSCKPYEMSQPLDSMSNLEYPYPTKFLSLSNEVEIAYVEEGQGKETLLFIHGLGSYLPAWKNNIAQLRDQYRCIAIDLPGYGKSSKGDYKYDMKFFADIIAEFIQNKGLEKVVLVGHSMGGQIAITSALYHPQLVDKLVLVAPAGFEQFHEGQKQWFREILTAKGVQLTPPETIQANLAYNFYEMPSEAKFMIADRIAMRSAEDFEWYCLAVERSVKGMVDQPVFEFLKDVNQSTLVLFGSNDNLIPNRFLNPGATKEIAKSGAAELKNVKLKMLPKTGHFAMFESAEEVNQSIQEFLQ